MSKHQEWKMMHLLHRCSHTSSDGTRKVLTETELRSAGVHCEMDTWMALRDTGLVNWLGGEWEFGGVHYYEYELVDLATGAQDLTDALKAWAENGEHRLFGVKDLEDRKLDVARNG